MTDLQPVMLEGRHVHLEPLAARHEAGLAQVVEAGGLWLHPHTFIPRPADVAAFIEAAQHALEEGRELAFAIVDRASGTVVGSSRFRDIRPHHRTVEIGLTFIAVAWQGSYANTESRYLMLRYAFEAWQCRRVQFMADRLNTRSRESLRRLGAREEGTLRRHLVMPDGRSRDTVVYSVIDEEWPAIRRALEDGLLGRWYGAEARR